MKKLLRRAGACALLLGALASACAATSESEAERFEVSTANLLVVLRETPGANKQDEALHPFGKIAATLADGRDIEFEASWFQYLGDMHLRLVFDGERRVQSAVPGDLQRLRLTPEEALEHAVGNLRRRYGSPVAEPRSGGLMQVRGKAPELDSSWFLDRAFWEEQLRNYPQGVVVAVPKRGGLVFARADDEVALTSLRFSAAALYAANDRSRLSSGLYLFKDGRWSVFQAPRAVLSAEH
ncbi:hypothetical protein HK414_16920 [Ramlibacter terrae]|uniref:Lipoprotein n=1 Tax=Ramlibacter terrae TaxID=2732511 RepID=A0ABX6P5H0_9BURK|nr:hypothetical protein HK414_16920 [Ramlibacter terrae]